MLEFEEGWGGGVRGAAAAFFLFVFCPKTLQQVNPAIKDEHFEVDSNK